MISRRSLLLGAAAFPARAAMTPRQRIDRVLKGQDTDRQPFSFWYHFGLEKFPGDRHAEATLKFHRAFRTDLVKVMSDFPYPKPAGPWFELKEEKNPFPEQVRALELIRDGLKGSAHFIETVFNPWNVAEKLSSPEQVLRLKQEKPQALLDALEVIARSEASHARRAIQTGASGVILGGLDETSFRTLSEAEMKTQWETARREAGRRFLLAPGCSVPNETTDEELLRLTRLLGA